MNTTNIIKKALKEIVKENIPYAKKCIVREVDETTNTCTVEPIDTDTFNESEGDISNYIYDVRYSPINPTIKTTNNITTTKSNFYIKVAKQAYVYVMFFNETDAFIVQTSEIDTLNILANENGTGIKVSTPTDNSGSTITRTTISGDEIIMEVSGNTMVQITPDKTYFNNVIDWQVLTTKGAIIKTKNCNIDLIVPECGKILIGKNVKTIDVKFKSKYDDTDTTNATYYNLYKNYIYVYINSALKQTTESGRLYTGITNIKNDLEEFYSNALGVSLTEFDTLHNNTITVLTNIQNNTSDKLFLDNLYTTTKQIFDLKPSYRQYNTYANKYNYIFYADLKESIQNVDSLFSSTYILDTYKILYNAILSFYSDELNMSELLTIMFSNYGGLWDAIQTKLINKIDKFIADNEPYKNTDIQYNPDYDIVDFDMVETDLTANSILTQLKESIEDIQNSTANDIQDILIHLTQIQVSLAAVNSALGIPAPTTPFTTSELVNNLSNYQNKLDDIKSDIDELFADNVPDE